MKNYIQVNNFKKYISTPEIELNDLNFFVGTNSSGKSTLVKAYLLITRFIKSDKLFEIDFSDPLYKDLNIQDFSRLICKYSNPENNIKIILGIDDYIFELTLVNHQKINAAKVLSYKAYDYKNNIIYEYIYKKGNVEILEGYLGSEERLNEEFFRIELINNILYKDDILKIIEKLIFEEEDSFIIDCLNKEYKLLENSNEIKNIKLSSNSDYISIESFKETSREILNSQRNAGYHSNLFQRINKGIINEYNPHINKIISHYRLLNINNKSLNENTINIKDILQSDKNIDLKLSKGMELSSKALKIFKTIDLVNSIYFPLTFRKYSNLNFISDTSNDLAQLIHNYFSASDRIKNKTDNFIKFWLNKDQFNIGDDFEINFYGGEAYEVLIHENNVKIPLVDKGTGNIQIFKILLLIATLYRNMYYTSTIILEEPELNLHPSIQSKLADLIVSINDFWKKEFGDDEPDSFKIIIETHSEYLIRRLQVLSAQNEIDNDKLKITYFPSEFDKKPFTIGINKDGSLDKNFGSGFFDEASNHTLELIKFKRLSQN